MHFTARLLMTISFAGLKSGTKIRSSHGCRLFDADPGIYEFVPRAGRYLLARLSLTTLSITFMFSSMDL
jgi:hypothetical protein